VQKLVYKALIPGKWAFKYLKYSVCNVLKMKEVYSSETTRPDGVKTQKTTV
jgi:hypothetical protein